MLLLKREIVLYLIWMYDSRSGLWPSTTSGRQKVINSKTGEYGIYYSDMV